MTSIREAAVAGLFYPGDPHVLRAEVERLVRDARAGTSDAGARESAAPPKALIAPHAGYIYSGPIAARAYARVKPLAAQVRRVVLLGPSHFVPFAGLALSGADAFMTPLGPITIDRDALAALAEMPGVLTLPAAHEREHSLEVQLPFLQVALREFKLVPLAVGDAPPEQVAAVIDKLWGGAETLIVVSSDLSHYHPYKAAVVIDGETTRAIEHFDDAFIDGEHACGCHPIRGLLHVARRRGLRVATLDQRNSGDTAGDRSRVVGYGAWAFSEAA
jgi:MEMO1 family protein